jgi:hypothetical protein
MAVDVTSERERVGSDELIARGVDDKTTTNGKSVRLNLVLPERSASRLENLKRLTEATSYTEVIRNAIRLYEAAVMEYERGNKLQIVDKNGKPLGVNIF